MNISLAHGTDAEVQTRDRLQNLLDMYDLQPWKFTDAVVIDETSVPHSHPLLTLNTRHRNDDLLLLSTYLHEQLHWFIWLQPDERVEPAIVTLMARYAEPPVGFPEGAGDTLSTYFHHLISSLEYLSLRRVVGEREAHRAISYWQSDHYTEIYRTVMQDMRSLDAIARRNGLIPPSLLPAAGNSSDESGNV